MSSSLTTPRVILIVLSSFGILQALAVAPLLIKRRKLSPLPARPVGLSCTITISTLIWLIAILVFAIIDYDFKCEYLVIVFFAFCFPVLAYSYMSFLQRIAPSERMFKWGDTYLRSELGMLQVLCGLVALSDTLCLIPFLAAWYGSGGSLTDDSFKEQFCEGLFSVLLYIAPIAFNIIFSTGLLLLVYRAHDGLAIKNEFKALQLAVPLLQAAYIALMLTLHSLEWGLIPTCVLLFWGGFVSNWYPLVLSYRKEHSGDHSSDSTSDNKSPEGEGAADVTAFREFPAVSKFITQKGAKQSIERYLVHFQQELLSVYWSFWKDIIAYKTLSNPAYRGGRAYLMYQKYIAEDALVSIPFITEEQRAAVKQPVLSNVEAVEAGREEILLGADIFDPLLLRVEHILAGQVFLPYTHSLFYREFKMEQKTLSLTQMKDV